MLTMKTFLEARHARIVSFRPHTAHYRTFTADAFMNTVTTIVLTIELFMIDPRESKLIDFQDKILVI